MLLTVEYAGKSA
ncbi:hypothetical protein CGLO_18191 [Colletotrichum gloeosporioides Cg-14]|uniref:Uncharacterized protein n=1 Tax=Colletotrichum gloeosporioides (strain Cg-14) TaxID=1237896 RepID=T0JUZ2_COLGC|nr:hypothetical protein CGLO_18191 [Colletotrichum gloeosporioides Cg-14]